MSEGETDNEMSDSEDEPITATRRVSTESSEGAEHQDRPEPKPPDEKPETTVDPVDILKQQLRVLSMMSEPELKAAHTRLMSELPAHVKPVYEKSENILTLRQNVQVLQTLIHFADVFAEDDFDIGEFEGVEMKIDLVDDVPIRMKTRRTPIHSKD